MKCEQTLTWISDLLDGTIDEPREVLARQHLAECADCARELEEMRRTWQVLGAIERVEPPAWFHESLMAQVGVIQENQKRTAHQSWWKRLLLPDTPGRWAAMTAAAAFLFMTLLSVFLNGTKGTVEGFIDGFKMLAGMERAETVSSGAHTPISERITARAESVLAPTLIYNRNEDTLTLTAQGSRRLSKVSVWVLDPGASFDPGTPLDNQPHRSASLEPRQSLHIPFRIPDSLEAGMTVTVVTEWDGGDRSYRYLLYLPASAHRTEHDTGTVDIEAGTELREAIRQIAESSATAFWVDARLIGRVQEPIVDRPAIEALQEILQNSGAAYEKIGNLYSIKMKP